MAKSDFKSYDEKNMGVTKAELDRGTVEATPSGDYEGELGDDRMWEQNADGEFVERKVGTLHQGQIEADGWQKNHAPQDEYGFVRRPTRRYDVERN